MWGTQWKITKSTLEANEAPQSAEGRGCHQVPLDLSALPRAPEQKPRFHMPPLPVHVLPECRVTSAASDLCDPMDCSPPGSSVHGILKAYHWHHLGSLPLPGPVHNPIGPCIHPLSINPRLEHIPYGHTATIQCLNVWTLCFGFFFFFCRGQGSHLLACGSLVSWPEIKSVSPALEGHQGGPINSLF